MTCSDVERLADAFVDTELPPAMLLDVARHAGTCRTCDDAIRELESLRQSVMRSVQAETDGLDLSPVWPAVATSVDRREARRVRVRRLRSLPVWGAAAAMAAGAVFWLQMPAEEVPARRAVERTAFTRNHAYIDRLTGKDITVRREPKDGTTVIWVNHTVEGRRR